MKLESIIVSCFLLSSLTSYAGTVDVGSGSRGSLLSSEVESLISLNESHAGVFLKKQIRTKEKCIAVLTTDGKSLTAEIINTTLLEQGADYPLAVTRFQSPENGSELLMEPAFVNDDKQGVELSLVSANSKVVSNLIIRSSEGMAVVSIVEKPQGDLDVAAKTVSCALGETP